jgi:large subunit ribosomal protein L21
MYAVIEAGSRQFKVSKGDTLVIDRMQGKAGDTVTFDKVLMLGGGKMVFGVPHVAGAKVEAKITSQEKADKIVIFKYKRRKNYKRTNGHRQPITVLEIGNITG